MWILLRGLVAWWGIEEHEATPENAQDNVST